MSEYKIFAYELDSKNESLIMSIANTTRHNYLYAIKRKIEWDHRRFQHIIKRMSSINTTFTIDTVIKEFINKASEIMLFNYMQTSIIRLWEQGQHRTSETYTATLNSFYKSEMA